MTSSSFIQPSYLLLFSTSLAQHFMDLTLPSVYRFDADQYMYPRILGPNIGSEAFALDCYWNPITTKAFILSGSEGIKQCQVTGLISPVGAALSTVGTHTEGTPLHMAMHRFILTKPHHDHELAEQFTQVVKGLRRIQAVTPSDYVGQVPHDSESIQFTSHIFRRQTGRPNGFYLDDYPVPACYNAALEVMKPLYTLRGLHVSKNGALIPRELLELTIGSMARISFAIGYTPTAGMRCMFSAIEVLYP